MLDYLHVQLCELDKEAAEAHTQRLVDTSRYELLRQDSQTHSQQNIASPPNLSRSSSVPTKFTRHFSALRFSRKSGHYSFTSTASSSSPFHFSAVLRPQHSSKVTAIFHVSFRRRHEGPPPSSILLCSVLLSVSTFLIYFLEWASEFMGGRVRERSVSLFRNHRS